MKFTKTYCYGGSKRDGKDDFITRYTAENGTVIDVEFLAGNESFRQYRVNGKAFDTLAKAKAAC